MYGRGACDTKVSVAAMLATMERIADQGTPPQSCIWAATVDEECLFQGITRLVQDDIALPIAGAVVGEPTQLDIAVRHKGRVWLKVIVFGKEARSSRPDQGQNAIAHAAPLIQALGRYDDSLA